MDLVASLQLRQQDNRGRLHVLNIQDATTMPSARVLEATERSCFQSISVTRCITDMPATVSMELALSSEKTEALNLRSPGKLTHLQAVYDDIVGPKGFERLCIVSLARDSLLPYKERDLESEETKNSPVE